MFSVRIKIDDFVYSEIEADTVKEAKERALSEMLKDIYDNPYGISSRVTVRKRKPRSERRAIL
jgi:hypothetical protein